MPTFNQLLYRKKACQRVMKKHYNRTKHLRSCPQKKGVCVRVYITKPKKPNSALRKVAKVALGRNFKAKKILVAIPGQGHTLQKFSVVMVRGGRVRDIPGVRYKLMRGKYDFTMGETFTRVQRRSFYGIPKPKGEFLKNKRNN
jgi:small subunit ribosomal protein S12